MFNITISFLFDLSVVTKPPSSERISDYTSSPTLPSIPSDHNLSSQIFSYKELEEATAGFSDANLLGEGGFGYVHRGVLSNGKEVAIKQLKPGSLQGETAFMNEVEIIGKVSHKHLVSLHGYCIHQEMKLLVFDFVPNQTLEHHLRSSQQTLDWTSRIQIAHGAARGIAYLHEDCLPKIIHRDIKASNILLDFSLQPKVADFGLAKIFPDEYTHVTTRIMGTFGYVAPEYAQSGTVTEKADIYSYGIVLLELISGRPVVDTSRDPETDEDYSLIEWARPLLEEAIRDRNYESIADPRMLGNYDPDGMTRMVACAAACVRQYPKQRPKMRQVVRVLEGEELLEDIHASLGIFYDFAKKSVRTKRRMDSSATGSVNVDDRQSVPSGSDAFSSHEQRWRGGGDLEP